MNPALALRDGFDPLPAAFSASCSVGPSKKPREAPSMVRLPPKISQKSHGIPKCGKLVKLFPHGTKVFSLIPQHFHPYIRKEFWPVLPLDLVF
jgi:hypothetical protein